tara:strand:+ start:556 stop:1170 length:615 start_codon:yes stop_codon:yes gene_type:complete
MKLKSFNITSLGLLFSLSIFANSHSDHSSDMKKDFEIKAYTGAAPDFIGNFATVIGSDGKVLKEGTNGWTCLAFTANMMGDSMDPRMATPACMDSNAMAWANAYMNQEVPKLKNDGWAWMIHGDTGADNFRAFSEGDKAGTDPEDWIESGAHLMLMPKDPSSLDNTTTDFTTGSPYVMFKDTPYVHLMIPVSGYYDFQPESAPK